MIFVDTGAWIERDLKGREHPALADRGWRQIRETRGLVPVTTDLVISELATFIKRKGAPELAGTLAAEIVASPVISIETITAEDRDAAGALFRKFRDQKSVSWCDCVSFAVMKRLKIRRAFAFDGDFDSAGFEFWPDPDFRPRR